jgi:hypothetical protein
MQSLLNQVERAQVDMEGIAAALAASQFQCEILLANKNALWHAMGHMVPQTDLEAARAAHAELASAMDQRSLLERKMQEEIDSVTVRMQSTQNEVDRLLKEIQVVLSVETVLLNLSDCNFKGATGVFAGKCTSIGGCCSGCPYAGA